MLFENRYIKNINNKENLSLIKSSLSHAGSIAGHMSHVYTEIPEMELVGDKETQLVPLLIDVINIHATL